jgi:hypothetical protein
VTPENYARLYASWGCGDPHAIDREVRGAYARGFLQGQVDGFLTTVTSAADAFTLYLFDLDEKLTRSGWLYNPDDGNLEVSEWAGRLCGHAAQAGLAYALYAVASTLPVYHYTSAIGLKGIIETGVIRATTQLIPMTNYAIGSARYATIIPPSLWPYFSFLVGISPFSGKNHPIVILGPTYWHWNPFIRTF